MLTPSQKGAIAEAAGAAAVTGLGYTVLRPLCEGRRYDLVLDLEPRLLRVQCKAGRLVNGRIEVRLQSNRLTPAGYVYNTYSAAEIDAIGVYCPDAPDCYLLPIDEIAGQRALHLRMSPPRNSQLRGVRWARDFRLEDRIEMMRAENVIERS